MSKTIALRVPVEHITKLRSHAKRHERTVSSEIRLLIREHLEELEGRKAA